MGSTKQPGYQLRNMRAMRGGPGMVAMQHTLLRLLWSASSANNSTTRVVDDGITSVADHDICFDGRFHLGLAARVMRVLELAAFLAQTSHETTGGWATAPGGPQAWGYCFKEEVGCDSGTCTQYCAAGNPCADKGFDRTCAPGQTYHGRGPMQLSWNYNYGYFSEALLGDASVLLNHPSQLTSDPVLAYKAAIWFWMTAQAPKPSCHAVLTGQWSPSTADQQLGRTAGFGMCTNIINGGIECNKPTDAKVTDRVEFFKRYLSILKVSVPDDSTLYCDSMASYR